MLSRPRPRPIDVLAPCLPSLVPRPPSGADWLHEIKHDGYRTMVRRDAGGVHVITRNGFDWTSKFPQIAAAGTALKARSFLIDGEAVCCDDSGLAVFADLRRTDGRARAFLYAFDLIEIDGADLRPLPIEKRKHRLLRLLRRAPYGLRYNEHVEGEGELVFAKACELGCEGIISKRRGSRYRSGRSSNWLKTKNPAAPAARRLIEEDWR